VRKWDGPADWRRVNGTSPRPPSSVLNPQPFAPVVDARQRPTGPSCSHYWGSVRTRLSSSIVQALPLPTSSAVMHRGRWMSSPAVPNDNAFVTRADQVQTIAREGNSWGAKINPQDE
jgi:hypothetical protein